MGVKDITVIRDRRNLNQRFCDLVAYSNRVIAYTHKLSERDFLRNGEIIDATERCLSIIGDLVDTLDADERKLYFNGSLIPFTGLGDFLIQNYQSVDGHKVWLIARNEVPALKSAVESTLQTHFPNSTSA